MKTHRLSTPILFAAALCLQVGPSNAADFDEAVVFSHSRVSAGDSARLQRALAKARRGETVTVGVIGGSITQGAKATKPELRYGDLVAAWADQSGAGNHVSQSTAAQRPMFIAAAVNGRPVVRFDGVDDGLVSAPSSSLAFTEGTLFVVRNNETDTAAVAVSVVDSIDEEFLLSSTSIYHESEAFNCVCLPHEGSRPGYIVQCGRFGTGPTALENFINGEASRLTMQSFGTPAAYTAVDRVVYVGMRGWPGESLAGDIAEVIVYQGLLTDADRGRVERYLKGRYGIL